MISALLQDHLPSIVLFACAIAAAFLGNYSKEKKAKSFALVMILVLSASVTLTDSMTSSRQVNRIETNTIDIQELNELNVKITKNVAKLSDEIKCISEENGILESENLRFSRLNSELNDRVLGLTNRISEFIKGENSFCFLTLFTQENSDIGQFYVRGIGENPLRNVKVRMIDLNSYPWNGEGTGTGPLKLNKPIEDYFTYMDLGNINPNGKLYFPNKSKKSQPEAPYVVFATRYTFVMDKQKGVKLNFSITTDNDYWQQELRMYHNTNRWIDPAVKVTRMGKTIYKKIPLGFPKELLTNF